MTTQELDEVRPQRRRRAWYKRRDILFIATALAIWIAWEGYGRISAPSRMTPALEAALASNPDSLTLLVTAKFQPERFHSNVYNTIGTQRGTDGPTTVLARVSASNVKWLARQYWIENIDLAPPGS